MKKLISFILAAVVLLGLVPVHALASESSSITREDVIAMACEVFPEHEAQIRGDTPIQVASSRNANDDLLGNIVVCETRMNENGEIFTYRQYSRGLSFVQCFLDIRNLVTSSGSGYANRKCDLYFTCNASDEVLIVKNFSYTLVQGGYDVINNYGTINTSTAIAKITGYQLRENASNNAYVNYSATYTPNVQSIHADIKVTFHVEVGDESCTYYVQQS